MLTSTALRAFNNNGIVTEEILKTTLAHTALKILDGAIFNYAATPKRDLDDSICWADVFRIGSGLAYLGIRGADFYMNGSSAMLALMRLQPLPLMKMLPVVHRFA